MHEKGDLVPDLNNSENLKAGEGIVTNDVLKRAENALFHKTVTTRPSEGRKASPKVRSDVQSDVKSPRDAQKGKSLCHLCQNEVDERILIILSLPVVNR